MKRARSRVKHSTSNTYISLLSNHMGELLIERRPIVGEGVADHPLHPFPRCSIQYPIGTVPYFVDIIVK